MAGPAAEADHDDRLPSGLGSHRSRGSETQQVGQGQAADAQRADAQKIAPRNAVTKLQAAMPENDVKQSLPPLFLSALARRPSDTKVQRWLLWLPVRGRG